MRAIVIGRVARMIVLSALLVVVGAGVRSRMVRAAAAQMPSAPGGQNPGLPSNHPELPIPGDEAHDPVRERARQQVIVSANVARHKRMAEDANKLLDLSKQLKDDVDKAGNDELSVEVMRKAAEIEKLAHDVRERMRQ
jgi:hypothetical protein